MRVIVIGELDNEITLKEEFLSQPIALTHDRLLFANEIKHIHIEKKIEVKRIAAGKSLVAVYTSENRLYISGFSLIISKEDWQPQEEEKVKIPYPEKDELLCVMENAVALEHLSVGDAHVLFTVLQGRELYSVGRGDHGELGIGRVCFFTLSPQRISLPHEETILDVSAGSFFSCIVTISGRVYTFGCGAYHRLGSGHSLHDILSPALLLSLEGVGNLLPNGTSQGIGSVACGKWHAVALAANSLDVYIWGWCSFGQGGNFQPELLSSPQRITALDDDENKRFVFAENEIFVKVVCSTRATVLLTNTGRVFVL